MKVAFIGLGVMGYPMAGHVKNAGIDVCVYNRTEAKARKWCDEYEGDMAPTPAKATRGCDVVLVCVGNDNDVSEFVHCFFLFRKSKIVVSLPLFTC